MDEHRQTNNPASVMGYQLWASPVTGHRRVGTRLAEVKALFGRGITVSAIMERLLSARADADAAETAGIMKLRDFDVVGVINTETKEVIGYVTAKDLDTGSVRDTVSEITPKDLVAESTPLAAVYDILEQNNHVFVLSENTVTGIVTRADLNKPPARIYVFALVSLVEMHLGYWIRSVYGEEGWHQQIKEKRLQAAQAFQEERRRRKQDLTLVECLQYADKRDLVVSNKGLRKRLGMGSKGSAERMLSLGEKLRNDVAHSQSDISHAVGAWSAVIDFMRWSEGFLDISDSLVDKDLQAAGGGYVDALHPPPA